MPAGERREEILDAAAAVFATRSFREVGTAEIATAAGVSEPTLYRYFPSKRALYLAMLDRTVDSLLRNWSDVASASSTPLEALRAIGTSYFSQWESDPTRFLVRARSLVETGDEIVAAHARERFLQSFEMVLKLYDDAKSAGLIDPSTDTRAHAWLFLSVGTLLDQVLLMDLKGVLDFDEIRRVMAVVRPLPRAADEAASDRKVARTRRG